MIIIPAIDIRGGHAVRLEQGDFDRETQYGTPIEMAIKWQNTGASLLHIVDLDGARTGASCNLPLVQEICASVTCTCELGGGIRKLGDVQDAVAAGVDRVILGTSLANDPRLASALLEDLSTDQLIAGIDAHEGMVAVEGWQERSTVTAVDLAKELYDYGIRRFIYTDIARDGMFTGPHLGGLIKLCDALPEAGVIASGGIATPEHVHELARLQRDNLEGAIVGKALYDGRTTYEELSDATA